MNRIPRLGDRLLIVLPWLLVVGLVALNLLHMAQKGINDDAYITYRVARNLAAGYGPVFNPGERVFSITTPGYALLLAASSLFSQDFVLLATVLNGLALVAVGALVIDLSRMASMPPGLPLLSSSAWQALVASLAVALTLTFSLLTEALGMETALYVAALLAALAAYQRAFQGGAAQSRWLLGTAVAVAAAFLLRPDGALMGIALAWHWLSHRRRVPWPALVLALALSLPWVLFAWAYYGSPIPNTLMAKITQGMQGARFPWGLEFLRATGEWALANPAAVLLAGLGIWQRPERRLPMLRWAALYIGAHTLLGVRAYFWYYAPLAPVAALAAGDGLLLLGRGLPESLTRRWPVARTGVVALVFMIFGFYSAGRAALQLAGPPPLRDRELAFQQTGEMLRATCAAQDGGGMVGMLEIGLIGYVSNCPVLDFAGLLQPDVAELRGGLADKITWAIKRYAPPMLILSGSSGFPAEVANAPWFRLRYAPVAIHRAAGFRSVVYSRWPSPSAQQTIATGWWRDWQPAEATKGHEHTLFFPAGTQPDVTLHAYLPLDSVVTITAEGLPPTELRGDQAAWLDYPLPALAAAQGPVVLSLSGVASDLPAAVAWIESNAVPTAHYFETIEDLGAFPRPSVTIGSQGVVTATLAAGHGDPMALEIGYRDWPNARLEVTVASQLIGILGGKEGWQRERLLVPDGLGPVVEVELRSIGEHNSRVVYVALVDPSEQDAALP